MGQDTEIEWAGIRTPDGRVLRPATWNYTRGCIEVTTSDVSGECLNCYAVLTAHRLAQNPNPKVAALFEGLTRRDDDGKLWWTGRVNVSEEHLRLPLRWTAPHGIFANSLSDWAHVDIPREVTDQAFAVMALTQDLHIFQLLTKRPRAMVRYLNDPDTPGRIQIQVRRILDEWPEAMAFAKRMGGGAVHRAMHTWPLTNVWLGVSVGHQHHAYRLHSLAQVEGNWPVRWVSAEPLLGPLDLSPWLGTVLNWVVVGGESKSGSRAMHPDWPRQIRDACVAAGVPLFFKQWGDWVAAGAGSPQVPDNSVEPEQCVWVLPDGRRGPMGGEVLGDGMALAARVGKRAAGRVLDGRTWSQFPGVMDDHDGGVA